MSDAKPEKFGGGVIFRPGGIPKDKPISRDILGAPGSVKVPSPYGPKTVVQRQCFCVECRNYFWYPEESMICPPCQGELGLALGLLEKVSDGNLPPMVTRTRGTTKPVSVTGARPKIQGDVAK